MLATCCTSDIKPLGRIRAIGHRFLGPSVHTRTRAPAGNNRMSRSMMRPGWPTWRSPTVAGPTGLHRVSAARGAVVRATRHPRAPAPDRQRECVSLAPVCAAVSCLVAPSQIHTTLYAPDERQGRALHPNLAPRMGVSPPVSELRRAHRRPAGVPPLLSPTTIGALTLSLGLLLPWTRFQEAA